MITPFSLLVNFASRNSRRPPTRETQRFGFPFGGRAFLVASAVFGPCPCAGAVCSSRRGYCDDFFFCGKMRAPGQSLSPGRSDGGGAGLAAVRRPGALQFPIFPVTCAWGFGAALSSSRSTRLRCHGCPGKPAPQLYRPLLSMRAYLQCVCVRRVVLLYIQGRGKPRKAQARPNFTRACLSCFAFRGGPALVAHACGCLPFHQEGKAAGLL